MTKSIKNTNDKNIGQSSNQNPGWSGSGVPTLKKITYKTLQNVKSNILKWNFKLLLNNLKTNLLNIYVFTLKVNKKEVFCPCCNWTGPGFIATCNEVRITKNSKCPICDSRSRHRGLHILIPNLFENKNHDLLFFAPEKILIETLNNNLKQLNIKTTDYYSNDVDFPNEDIQNLSFPDKSFNYILCNHVIEHVPNDNLAFKEISRILKNNGKAIITIPGDYHLNKTKEFKQTDSNGHFRHYGKDVVKKMELHFKKVESIDMNSVVKPEFKVRKNDFVFICYK